MNTPTLEQQIDWIQTQSYRGEDEPADPEADAAIASLERLKSLEQALPEPVTGCPQFLTAIACFLRSDKEPSRSYLLATADNLDGAAEYIRNLRCICASEVARREKAESELAELRRKLREPVNYAGLLRYYIARIPNEETEWREHQENAAKYIDKAMTAAAEGGK